MYSRTPQEDLLILEALVDFHWRRRNEQPERAARAWVLATEIADRHGLRSVEDALEQRAQIK